MKKRLQGLIAGVLVGVMLATGIPALAAATSKTAEIFYNNIKIFIDGAEIVPKDATGKVVEPFIMNGTTYLPIRAVANAFGKEVEWDGKTASAYIGGKDFNRPDNRLDNIQYNDYQYIDSGDDRVEFKKLNGTITDFNDKVYTNGLLFSGFNGGGHRITFPLNQQYANLSGNVIIPKLINDGKANSDSVKWEVRIFCDDQLVQTIKAIPTWPFEFSIDVVGVNNISFELSYSGSSYNGIYVALTDLALYK